MRTCLLGFAALATLVSAARAESYLEYPAPTPFYPFRKI